MIWWQCCHPYCTKLIRFPRNHNDSFCRVNRQLLWKCQSATVTEQPPQSLKGSDPRGPGSRYLRSSGKLPKSTSLLNCDWIITSPRMPNDCFVTGATRSHPAPWNNTHSNNSNQKLQQLPKAMPMPPRDCLWVSCIGAPCDKELPVITNTCASRNWTPKFEMAVQQPSS